LNRAVWHARASGAAEHGIQTQLPRRNGTAKKISSGGRRGLIAEKCLLYLAALLHSHTFIA
jgi:hypothetical protein